MNEPITAFRSRVVPFVRVNTDTDQIIPGRFVTVTEPDEFAHALFRNLRDADPSFVIDRPEMQGRTVLLGGPNFGCGSSREAAVWALVHGGFRAVIAPSFGDIFHTNSLKNGLVPVRASEQAHAALVAALDADPELEVVVDLPDGRVTTADGTVAIELDIDPFYRQLMVTGMDEIDYLLGVVPDAERYEVDGPVHPTTRRLLAVT